MYNEGLVEYMFMFTFNRFIDIVYTLCFIPFSDYAMKINFMWVFLRH